MKKQKTYYWSIALLLLLCLSASFSYAAANEATLLNITGAIGPATQDYVQRGLEQAATDKNSLVILRLDTPGGLETSMRGINKAILASRVPVVTYVSPTGARAASAGTFILYASHIAAMAPGTNLGAAAPVNILQSPTATSEKAPTNQHLSTLEKKSINDASAYIRSLAELRGRNVVWAEQAVREAVSLSATEALKLNVIDIIANDIPALLQKTNGRTVNVNNVAQKLQTENIKVTTFEPGWRFQFLSILTDPNIAYILLLIGIYGLFFEFYNPGFVLPGVMGAISLLFALYAFQLLPVNYVGFALLLLGIAFMIAEIAISSFGILGIGGIIAFVTGSILLLDINSPGYQIAWSLIIIMTLFSLMFFLLVIGLTVRSMRKKVVTGNEALIGSEGEVIEYRHNQWRVRIHGEIWNANSSSALYPTQQVRVLEITGLLLTVEPIIKTDERTTTKIT